MRIFGGKWDAPVCDTAIEVDTPVGKICPECDEPIGPDDKGFVLPVYRADGHFEDIPWHRECNFMSTCGHMWGYCSCTSYRGLSRRIAALSLWADMESGVLPS